MKEIRRLLPILKPIHSALAGILFLSTAEAILASSIPWIYREVINFLTYGELSRLFRDIIPTGFDQVGVLLSLVGIYLVILFTEDISSTLRFYSEDITRMRSWSLLRVESLARLQALSMPYFYTNAPGAIAEKINAGLREAFPAIQIIMADVWPTLVKFLIAVVTISFINKWIALGLAVVMVAYSILALWRTKINKAAEEHYRKSTEESGKRWIGAITYQELIKQFAREDDVEAEMMVIYKNMIDRQRQRFIVTSWIGLAQEFMWKLVVGFVYGYGGYLVIAEKSLAVGDLILFIAYMEKAMNPLSYVLSLYDRMQTNLVSIRRMLTVWDTPVEVKDADGAPDLAVAEGAVEFKNVTFFYRDAKGRKGNKPVFNNFNLKIGSGETVALVGPSGAGKSTLVKLLLRFYDPDKGSVIIDGQEVSKVGQKSVRRGVSAIMQDVVVFNDTIAANLRYGKKSAKKSELEEALRAASLYDFVTKLPKKLNTVLGERGLRLSGGERQRLGLARALIKDAPIIVLDEATSALDSENEKKIQDAIENLIAKKTTIIIAHRLSTIKRADRIVVLDKGRVVEQGSHAQLLKKKGYYSRLYKMQGVLSKD